DSIAISNGSSIGRNAASKGQVLGDAGADTITINYGLVGASGAGTVSGGADNDSIALSNNTFVGNLAGSTGQVLGDAGADTITIDSSSVGRFGAGTVSGGANNDSIALSNGSFVGRSGGSTGQVLGDAGNDTITLANTTVGVTGNATVDGGTENDSIALSAGTNVGANGRILGNAGNDTISVDNSVIRNAAAVFDGGADTDQLTFTANANATVNPGEFVNFELLRKGGAANLTLTGNQTFATSTTVAAGSLTLGGGTLTTGLLDILNGGTFIPFSTVIGNVNNAGLVSPGGGNNQDTLTIQGDFTQSATGQLDIDIFAANGVADLVAVTGTATLGGTLNLIINGVIAPTNTYTILTATTVAGTFATVQQTAAIAQTVTVNPTNVVLEQSVDFAANAGTPNQIATGANLNDILLAGGASGNLQAAINAIGGIVDIATFQTALDLLHSEPYLAQLLTSWYNAQNFAQSMMSCPVTIDGSVAIGVEGECSWARIEGRSFDQDRTAANIGIEENVLSFSIGAQFAIAENASNGVWHLGLGANYEYIESDIDTRAASEGHRIALAASLKGQWGDTTLSTVLTASYGSFDMARFIVLPGFTATALGEQDVSQIGVYTRLAHSFIRDTHYIRPMIDLSANYIHTGSLTETGAGALGLNLASTGEWIFAATPAIEFGADIQQASGTTIRPFLRAGVTFLGSDQASVATSFIGAPAGVTPFRVTSNYDNVFAVIETGVTIINNDGLDLKLNYSGNFGENTQTHAGGFKLSFDY
ncbi:MAG: hypothetical protein JKY32_16625, partial [Rhizobiales bacterium]|nr:hypothetical protein [Hyphomicrobiales bacterium]